MICKQTIGLFICIFINCAALLQSLSSQSTVCTTNNNHEYLSAEGCSEQTVFLEGPPGPKGDKGETGREDQSLEDRISSFVTKSVQNAIKTSCPGVTFHLPRDDQVKDYVRYRGYVVQQTEGTICAWLDRTEYDNYATLMSYAVKSKHNEQLIAFKNLGAVRHVVRNTPTVDFTVPSLTSQTKHHICVWYSKRRRSTGIYLDADEAQTREFELNVIQGGGDLILGQDQDAEHGGSLDAKHAFSGNITNFMIWPRVLSQQEINKMAKHCECPSDYSLVMSLDKAELYGAATYSIPDECPTL